MLQDDLFNPPSPSTSAIYPNRIKDRLRVESQLGLQEEGNDYTPFYDSKGNLLAIGYDSICYGDHGPYVCFEKKHFQQQLTPKFKEGSLPEDAFYEWMTPVKDPNLKVYRQIKDVKNLKNPPGGFKPNRTEGYANYKPGFYYIGVWVIHVKPHI